MVHVSCHDCQEAKEKGCVAAAINRLEMKAAEEAAEAERIRQATLKFKAQQAWIRVVGFSRSAKGRVRDAVKQRKLRPLYARTSYATVSTDAPQQAKADSPPEIELKSYENPLRSGGGGGTGESKEPEAQQPFPHPSLFDNYRKESVNGSRRNSLTRARSRSRSMSPVHTGKPTLSAQELRPVSESK